MTSKNTALARGVLYFIEATLEKPSIKISCGTMRVTTFPRLLAQSNSVKELRMGVMVS